MSTSTLISVNGDIGFPERTILSGVVFELKAGDSTILMGVNGVGKTTTLNTLAGLRPMKKGVARVSGKDPSDVGLLGEVAFVSDSPGFYPELTGFEHVDLVGDLWGRQRECMPFDRIDNYLSLSSFADQPARRMSRGQQQRLALALTLVPDPMVMIMDEPFNALDYEGIQGLRSIISDRVASGGCVILSTHLVDVAAESTNRVLILKNGRLAADDRVDSRTIHQVVAEWHSEPTVS